MYAVYAGVVFLLLVVFRTSFCCPSLIMNTKCMLCYVHRRAMMDFDGGETTNKSTNDVEAASQAPKRAAISANAEPPLLQRN